MKRGPKPQTAVEKARRGTLRPDRDDGKAVQLITAGDPPAMPDYLSPAAQEIWIEEISRVMANGIAELDSSFFAEFCSMTALIRAAFIVGQAPPAAYLVEQRRRAELLGIAGPRTRQGLKYGGTQQDNPFERNGKRAA